MNSLPRELLQLKSQAARHLAPSGFRVVLPWESEYDAAKQISNVRFKSSPLAVAFPRTAEHVVQCVRFCQDHGLELRVRSGGHQHEGMSSGVGVFVVRLSEMNQIQWTDGTLKTAWIQVGARLEDVYKELARYGKIIPGGGCKGVNVGGLTLGGGWGLSARKYGLACDNVLEIEGVLADGRIVRATPDNAFANLFWALLGSGGGNFGIVTRFRFQLRDIEPGLSTYKVYWEAEHREKVIRRWLRYQREEQPENTTSYLVLYADFLEGVSYSNPPVYAGGMSYCETRDLMAEVYGWTEGIQPAKGPEFKPKPKVPRADGAKESLSLESGASLDFDEFPGWLDTDHALPESVQVLAGDGPEEGNPKDCHRVPFPTENCLAPHPHKVTSAFPIDSKGFEVDFEAKLARVITTFLESHPVDSYVKSYLSLYSMGGRIAKRPPEASAFWFRNKPFVIQIESWWNYPAGKEEVCRDVSWQDGYVEWVCAFREALHEAGLIEGAFINFVDRDIDLSEYYGGNFPRLKQAKKEWDPTDFFRFPMSIPLE